MRLRDLSLFVGREYLRLPRPDAPLIRRTRTITIDATSLGSWRAPASVPVCEYVEADDGQHILFRATNGPFSHYRRTVSWPSNASTDQMQVRLEETIELSVAMPFLGGVFNRLYMRAMGRRRPDLDTPPLRPPFWAPPDPLEPRAATLLGALVMLSFISGYLGTVVTTTITFVAREFDTTTRTQGIALAVIRSDILIALPLAALADRIGRRQVLRVTAVLGPIGTFLCALSPNIVGLTVTQVPTRGVVTVTAMIIGVILVEEMPAGSRAWAAGLLVAAAAIGSAMTLLVTPICDVSDRGWRIVFAIPALSLLILRPALRHIPESRRFRKTDEPMSAPHATAQRSLRPHVRRLALLTFGAALLGLFITPARQFNNDFLRREQGFSAGWISLFGLATAAPGAIGLLIGGRIADTRGKRKVVGAGLLLAVLANIAYLQGNGWPLWMWAVIGSTFAGVALPGQAIYGPELFPTAVRAKASAVITFAGRIGGIAGLVIAGTFGDNGRLGATISWLGLGGIAMATLVLLFYPETARRELEEINPSDAIQSATAAETTASRRASE